MNTLKILSIIVTLILINLVESIAQDGVELFDDTYLHEIRFTQVDTTIYIGSKDYQQVVMEIDGMFLDSTGIKRKGNISGYPETNKYGIKIKSNKFSKGQEYDGIKEWTLHMNYQDPSMLREKLTYDLCSDLGLYSLRTAFAKVYINDSYWGVFTIVEGKDEMYKQVFKNRDMDAVETLDFGNMCYFSANQDDYFNSDFPGYIVENGNENTSKQRFVEMLDVVNNTDSEDYIDLASQHLNIKDFMRYQALNVYLLNFDSYIGFRGNQIYVYDTIQNLWQVTPWDFNASFGLWNSNNHTPEEYPINPNIVYNGCIAEMIKIVPEMEKYYLDAMCELNSILGSSAYLSEIDRLADQIREAVYEDYRKVISNEDFENAIGFGYNNLFSENQPALKSFVETRFEVISEGLQSENYTCLLSSKESVKPIASLVPNPTSRYVNILGSNIEYSMYSIIDVHGNKIKAGKLTNDILDLGSVPDGIYFIQLGNEKSWETYRVIKSGN